MLTGGVLLWRRHPLGYVVGAGLLLQYGLTPLGLAASMALRAALTATPLDVGTSVALLVFSALSFAPLCSSFAGQRAPERLRKALEMSW